MFNWIVFGVHAGLGVFLSLFVGLMATGSPQSGAKAFWMTAGIGVVVFTSLAFINARYITAFRDTPLKSLLSGILGVVISVVLIEIVLVLGQTTYYKISGKKPNQPSPQAQSQKGD